MKDIMEKGYIHVYTGNGKGKTTAAFGLAIRAALSGKSVYIGQFIKGMKYNEVGIEEFISNIKIEQFGDGCFINREPEEKDILMAKEALHKCKEILSHGEYDLVILDEINISIYLKLFNAEEVIEILKDKNESTEVVLTGRYAPQEIIHIADLVTDMQEIKHYYNKGVLSRNGIDH